MNQRLLLLVAIIIISALATIAINNIYAEKYNWFNAKNFYKEVNKMDMFDEYPYDSPQLTVKIKHVGEPTTTNHKKGDKYLIEYMNHNEVFKLKDGKYKTKFSVGDSKKVCLMHIDTEFKKCKKFESFDDSSTITFFIK
jgi:hypothetical protein